MFVKKNLSLFAKSEKETAENDFFVVEKIGIFVLLKF